MRHDKLLSFLAETKFIADIFSKDKSTKVGAMFLNSEDFTQLTTGYNGMPRGIDESIAVRHTRPLKYSFFEHAERNALFNMARPYLKDAIVATTSTLSIGCVRAVISVGAKELWVPLQSAVATAEWALGVALLSEAGVRVFDYDPSTVGRADMVHQPALDDLRHVRKISEYLAYAHQVPKLQSKDPHGNATLYLHPTDFTVLARGYSGQPRGANDFAPGRYEGAARELWVEGSVRNAIYNLLRPLLKGSTALVTATTCGECARAIASVGAASVCYLAPSEEFKARWGESIGVALAMLDELGVSHQEVAQL